jgi:hypothetical protein
MRAIIHFLHARKMNAAEIHGELCAAVYDQDGTSEGTVRSFRFRSYGRVSLFVGF